MRDSFISELREYIEVTGPLEFIPLLFPKASQPAD